MDEAGNLTGSPEIHRRQEGLSIMTNLLHWFQTNTSVLAVLVTLGVAILLVCCLECSDCSKRDQDDLFKRHEV